MKYGCATPSQIVRPDGFNQLVPCGHCHGCITKRQMAWTLRICLEARSCASSSCLTLTYDEATRPGRLVDEHITRFLRRLRKSTPAPVRYFCVGEYGTVRGREHWHLILFNSPFPHMGVHHIPQWSEGGTPLGGVYFDQVTPESAAYCARYSLKTGAKGGDYVSRMSRMPGIGVDAIRQISSYLAKRQPVVEKAPSYWRMGTSYYPLDRTAHAAFVAAYTSSGGVIKRPDRSPLAYHGEAKISAMVGDYLELVPLNAIEMQSLERKALEHGTF